ncbi:hypothetical protein [Spirosoma agri]|uniref:Uncharacterized protein n=1 Tax=Spirosoma agri TaxID=1987381 RepID=A0A6M0IB12_9BACT|nr:hypothetical protein [Spirosoma agri]NEU65326.1 hypothetical protein [Spirosoma agri]
MSQHTKDLKEQIERILRWEPSSHWRPRDFAQLSELIQIHTRQPVDARALQIFWETSELSSPDMLDTLANFADYADWNDFYTRNQYGTVAIDDETALTHPPMWEIPIRWVIMIYWFSVVASIVVAFLLVWKR